MSGWQISRQIINSVSCIKGDGPKMLYKLCLSVLKGRNKALQLLV